MLGRLYGVAVLLLWEQLGMGHACFADGQTLICQDVPTFFSPGYLSLVVLIPDLGQISSTMFLSGNLVNVTRLTVKSNVTEMVPGALSSLLNLQTLILDENALTQIDPAWFSPRSAPALKDLSLVGNHIEVLSESTLGGLVGLRSLNLSRNRIRAIEPGSFGLQTELGSLDLSRNRLTRLSPLVLGSVRSTLLRLSENPWDCSCAAEDFVELLKDLKNRALLEQENEVTCGTPSHLHGRPVWNVLVCETSPPSSSSSSSSPPSLSTRPLMTSLRGTSMTTDLQPAGLSVSAVLCGVLVPLCALLGLLGAMGGLYGRKRRNRAVKGGPSAGEDPDVGQASQLQPAGSIADPVKRDAAETIRWHAERMLSVNSTTTRAKSADAALSTSPFSVGVKVSPGAPQSETARVQPGEPGENPAEPRGGLGTARGKVEGRHGGTGHPEDGQRHADKRVPSVPVDTEEVPYLSIGALPPKQEANIAAGAPGQRSGTGMSRVSSWPPSAAQWQDKGMTLVQGERANILTKHPAAHQQVNECEHGTHTVWASRLLRQKTPDGGICPSGFLSVTSDPEHCSVAVTRSTTEMLPLGGANGSQTEDPCVLSPTAPRQCTADTPGGRAESRRPVPRAAPPGALCDEHLTVDYNICPNLSIGTSSLLSDNESRWRSERGPGDQVEQRPTGLTTGAVGPGGPTEGGRQRAPVRYEDLLHEVVQNHGRWTRDRWRQTQRNKPHAAGGR